MKRILLTFCTAAFLLAACNNDEKTADAKMDSKKDDSSKMASSDKMEKKEQAWIPIDSAMEAKAMKECMEISDQQKMLAKSNGTWAADITMWMADGAPPMTSKGSVTNTMIMGGRYQLSKHTGNMMGMPFEGQGTIGFDKATNQYVSSWIDNMGTGIMNATGKWDDATKSITFTGTAKSPANGLDFNFKETFKPVDDNNQEFEMYGPDPKTGKEYKMMAIKYTRKK